MIAHAATVVAVADETKIGQAVFAHVAPLSAAALLVTDAELSPADVEGFREAGLAAILRA